MSRGCVPDPGDPTVSIPRLARASTRHTFLSIALRVKYTMTHLLLMCSGGALNNGNRQTFLLILNGHFCLLISCASISNLLKKNLPLCLLVRHDYNHFLREFSFFPTGFHVGFSTRQICRVFLSETNVCKRLCYHLPRRKRTYGNLKNTTTP